MRFRELDSNKRRRARPRRRASEILADATIPFVELTDGQLVALRTHLGSSARTVFAGVSVELRAPGESARTVKISTAFQLAGALKRATVAIPAADLRTALASIDNVDDELELGEKEPGDRVRPQGGRA